MKQLLRRKKSIAALVLSLVSAQYTNAAVTQLVNPVLPMRDGAVERFMGYYYATGEATLGKIHTSKDLVKWDNGTLCITTDKATWLNDPQWNQRSVYANRYAGDLIYRNGVFHSYWNGIGHAYCSTPLGNYTEHSVDMPFDNYGIDVQVFQDDNGDLFYVKKRNPADPHPMTQAPSNISGAEVWVMDMISPFRRWDITNASVQLTHQPGHPTSLNHINFEGPELFKHHGRYYLMFAVNRMGPRSGMYEVGVAESDGPMNFNNSKKYPHPILARNSEQQLLDYKPLITTAEHGGWDACYTLSSPEGQWTDIDYDASSWSKAQGGFGRQEFDLYSGKTFTNAKVRARKTPWTTQNIWIRREFNVDEIPAHLGLKFWINAVADIYINGNLLTFDAAQNKYSTRAIDPSWLRQGKNIIAVKATSKDMSDTGQQFIDFGLYDTGDEDIEDMVICPAQPNFVLGPNGFEHWMMYKAYFNNSQVQGVDRMHFYNNEVVCESPSVHNTRGWRPVPAQPTWINYFDNALYYSINMLDNSKWKIANKVLSPVNDNGGALLIVSQPRTNYRFEAPIRLASPDCQGGVYAYYDDNDNYLKVELARSGSWITTMCVNGNITIEEKQLPDNFKFIEDDPLVADYDEPWHTLVVYKNGGDFKVMLDYFDLTVNGLINTPFVGAGRFGLVSNSNNISFDALQYTSGWDEYNEQITGWEYIEGDWLVSEKGLSQTNPNVNTMALKGDNEWNYEFSCYMTMPSAQASGKSGFYPVYVDENNFVKAVVNPDSKALEITVTEHGTPTSSQSIPLTNKVLRQYTFNSNSTYPTNTYTYDLRNEAIVSGIDILWLEGSYPYLNQTFDLPKKVNLLALVDGKWQVIDAQLDGETRFSEYNHYSFSPITTTSIKMIVTPTSGNAARAFNVYVTEDMSAGYFLRARREEDGLRIFIDDRLMATVPCNFEPSRVALTTENAKADFNTILQYQSGNVRIKGLTLDPATCEVGMQTKLNAHITPLNASITDLYWESSNTEIATVDADGIVTRHQPGEVTITCYVADGGAIKASTVLGEKSNLPVVDNLRSTRIYPNPIIESVLNIESDSVIKQVSVYSLQGAQMVNDTSGSNSLSFPFPSGCYLVGVTTEDNVYFQKIVKK